jgi:competence protein ComEC
MSSASVSPLATMAFTAGILVVCAQAELPSPLILGVAALLALVPWRGRAIWAMAVLGALLATWQGQASLNDRWPAHRHGEEIPVRGRIASLPELSAEGDGMRTWRFLFEPEDPGLPQRIRVAWYRSDAQLRGAECWRFTLRMRTPHGSLNPGGFDYEAWLFRQGITATATVREGTRCEAPDDRWLLRQRQAITDQLREWIPDARARALVAALTTGDQSGLTDADWDVFRITGTSHLVAISGFNIAIIAAFAFFLVRWTWSVSARACDWIPAQRAAMVGSVVIAGFYAGLAGFEPPVARAWWMVFVVLLAAWIHRPASASRLLALAWLAILLVDPFAVLSPGLWLSFGAVAVIVYVTTGRLRQPGVVRALVRLQILLSLAIVPLTLYFFQGAAWLGPFVNLLAVPIVTVMTPVLLVGLGVAAAIPPIGIPLLNACSSFLVSLRDALADAAIVMPDAWIPASPPEAALLLALLGIALLVAPRGIPSRIPGALCVVPLLLPRGTSLESDLRLTVLDVGQGLSAVVQTRDHALLFDAGPAFEDGFDAGRSIVAPFLLREGIRSVNLLMLSHGDNDHAGGVPAVRKLLRVDREIGTDRSPPCRAGEAWEWDGVRFEVLHPPDDGWEGNDGSCVLRIDGSFSILLPGDIESQAERALLETTRTRLAADVVVAPHHGSKTSSTDGFVAALSPQLVVYSAGWRNHFGHPRPEVAARYRDAGTQAFMTGEVGAVSIERSGPVLKVQEWRRTHRRFWNAPPG